MTYARAVTAELYDELATTLIATLDSAFNIEFFHELNGYGHGSLSVPLSDSDAALLERGLYIKIKVAGTIRFGFKIEGSPQYQQIDEGEEVSQFLTVQGRQGAILDEAVVYPEGDLSLSAVLDYSYRLFSFASINFPNDGGWGSAQQMYEYHDFAEASTRGRVVGIENTGVDPDDPGDDELELYVAPIGFPWPNAPKNGNGFDPTPVYAETFWIIAGGVDEDDIGTHFFRGEFVLAGTQLCSFYITADNLFTMYLNGVPILGEDADMLMWTGWKEVTLELPAGTYTVAVAAENVDIPDLPYNPGGAIFNVVAISVYPGDVETSLTLVLLTSDIFMISSFVGPGGDWPGWTPGQIMIQLINEAETRGGLAALDSSTFTATTDSDGNAWDTIDPDTSTEYIPAASFRLGMTYGQVLEQMHADGWVDWIITIDSTLVVEMWAAGQVGVDSGVTFAAGTNIVGLERGETAPYANVLLVQWAGGMVEVEDVAAVTAAGTRIEDILQTDAASEDEAMRLGRVELLTRTADSKVAVVMRVEPTSTADCPYEAFQVGDYINIPQVDGVGTDNVQVLAIACRTDDEGNAIWTLEVNARWRAPQRDLLDLMRAIGGKSLGSTANHGVAKD